MSKKIRNISETLNQIRELIKSIGFEDVEIIQKYNDEVTRVAYADGVNKADFNTYIEELIIKAKLIN